MSAQATYFFGRDRYHYFQKAAKRGKVASVDWTLRSAIGRRLERNVMAVLDQWREIAQRKLTAAYRDTVKAADAALVDRILRALNVEAFSVDLIETITPELRRAFRSAGITALAEVRFESSPKIVQHLDERALAYAEQHSADLVTRVSETVRSDMRALISSAIEEGAGTDELGEAIAGMFAFSKDRGEMIARTELAFAHVQGNLAGYRETGLVDRKRWLVAQDNVCDVCAGLEGMVVGIDEEFETDKFDPVAGPPLHPNCRCDLLPVLEEES